MNAREQRCRRIEADRLIAVIRGRSADQVVQMADALAEGGVTTLEVTTTTPDWERVVADLVRLHSGRCLVGVGTVLDADTAARAIGAGAGFLVSPIARTALVEVAHSADVPVMLGAYTPTECVQVQESGADHVKLFPADTLGPGYMKALRAPLPGLRLVPTGGIGLGNVAAFLQAGAVAVGVGSTLLTPEILDRSDWPALARLARKFREAIPGDSPKRTNPYLRGEDRWRR